ncbi:putative dITP/XTP pyrophosphatase [Aliarcobacter faecis]|uniref:non-canonical purine NTP pyrophosphatase n=1 Tax=Aliarcobacter faecis TaxID=1564138 RepID=UPI00047D1537|nr:non-canonical purine NTP pyrophosphatase [Aliarcobacter faecis]QKF73798.1 putative dITP/XTP pyrophosphatase [Aliarcobacter faecis]
MKIVLASNNQGKIKEFKKLLPNDEVFAFSEILGKLEIEEDKDTFKGNAIKKAQTIYDELQKIGFGEVLVISDDSGISVPILNNAPGVYSARYAGLKASDKENNLKLIDELNKLGVDKTAAFYTACIAMVYKNEVYTVHGFMYGEVLNKELGENGFGYDPLFIPKGFSKTLGQLEFEVKQEFSHRNNALKLAKKVLDVIL